MGNAVRGRSRYPGAVDPAAASPSIFQSIPGLIQWYDASQIIGKVDGDRISSLADRSGIGNTLTAVSNGPYYRPYGVNGRPSMEFSGTDCILGGASRIVPLTNISIFLVLNYSGGRAIGLENDGSGSNGLAWYQKSLWVIRNGGSIQDLNIGSAPNLAIHSLLLGTGGASAKWNAAAVVTNANTAYTDASVSFKLGGSGNNGAWFSGQIAEYAAFNVKLTTTERDAIHSALNEKYHIY